MWTKESWSERVDEFLASKEDGISKYSWTFPMGVFGTLRERQGNNRRMHIGKVSDHRVGFLPHFYAEGLSVRFDKNSCAPFEVFYYEPEQWKKMIPGVDSLEGFSPGYYRNYDYGYFRTLVWINLLPKDTVNEWFPESKAAELWHRRDMKIDPKTWNDYEKVPAWVYSNVSSNRQLTQDVIEAVDNSPLIWPKPEAKEDSYRSIGTVI